MALFLDAARIGHDQAAAPHEVDQPEVVQTGQAARRCRWKRGSPPPAPARWGWDGPERRSGPRPGQMFRQAMNGRAELLERFAEILAAMGRHQDQPLVGGNRNRARSTTGRASPPRYAGRRSPCCRSRRSAIGVTFSKQVLPAEFRRGEEQLGNRVGDAAVHFLREGMIAISGSQSGLHVPNLTW